ncbi:MAG: hypothetical protein L6Q57_01965 [Alphaproteobacteria bacterium]|nr:hypothetical protein [Alphaproteobacteria bacterium]
MSRLHSCISLMALCAGVLVFAAPEAQAGFSWRSGNDTPPQQSDDFTPPPVAQPAAPLYATPPISLPPPASIVPSSPDTDRVVAGFGADMPLALALRDVVPPQYAYSFAPGVNPGLRVSWQGGQAWPLVVDQMIAPLGLRSRVYGRTVVIEPGVVNAPVMSVAPQAGAALPPPVVIEAPPAAQAPVIITPEPPQMPEANANRLQRRIISDPGPYSPRRSDLQY